MRLTISNDIPKVFFCERISPETGYIKCGHPAVRIEIAPMGPRPGVLKSDPPSTPGQFILSPFCEVCLTHISTDRQQELIKPEEVSVWMLMNS